MIIQGNIGKLSLKQSGPENIILITFLCAVHFSLYLILFVKVWSIFHRVHRGLGVCMLLSLLFLFLF